MAGARTDAVVIGAGHNGLTTAAYLAKAGRKVLVLERRDIIGGLAAGEEYHPGYRSAGLLHETSAVRRKVIEDLSLERHGLRLGDGPASVLSPSTDGPGLLLHHDAGAAAEEIGRHSARDADRYAEYRTFMARVGRITRSALNDVLPDLTSDGNGELFRLATSGLALRRLGKRDMMEIMRIGPMCVADYLNEWFETDALKCLLAAPSIGCTWMGPWSPGTNGNLIRSETTADRRVLGGPAALVDALGKAATGFGAEVRTGAAVETIRVSAGRIEGVTLAGGDTIDATRVVASCDPRTTFLDLLEPHVVPTKLAHRIEHFRQRGTTAKVNLALSGPLTFSGRTEPVAFAHTGHTLDGMEQAFDAVKYGRVSDAPLLDIHVASLDDPSRAPLGHASVSILVHFAPHALTDGWTDAAREALGDRVVDTLATFAPGVHERVVAREVLTPVDIEGRHGVSGGHVHHGEHALDQLLVRPTPECARYATPIEGLFLCGSGSHPGGGITCAPGMLAASAMGTG